MPSIATILLALSIGVIIGTVVVLLRHGSKGDSFAAWPEFVPVESKGISTLGHCPAHQHSSKDPQEFGPVLWYAFSIMALGYPAIIGSVTQIAPLIYQINAAKFIRALPFLLPCGSCGYNLHQFIRSRDLKKDTRTKTDLLGFFVDAHNNVVRHINKISVDGKLLPPQKLWTVAGVKDHYTCVDGSITDPRHWQTKNLYKSIMQSPGEYISDMAQPRIGGVVVGQPEFNSGHMMIKVYPGEYVLTERQATDAKKAGAKLPEWDFQDEPLPQTH